ncbi:hypothetical protein NDU88_001431 [Pleurodeles waltl]|uniref:Uncharacterized protein n=1 Tax=Pleurodeles waltl TaxID=8319 RepID=A0AAV7UUN3_PLEWA|nr:hypothetical protein NDU88_001431 [Pleurodeles waltl]
MGRHQQSAALQGNTTEQYTTPVPLLQRKTRSEGPEDAQSAPGTTGEPSRAELLATIQGSRVALEGKIEMVAVEVNLLQADLRKVSEKVKEEITEAGNPDIRVSKEEKREEGQRARRAKEEAVEEEDASGGRKRNGRRRRHRRRRGRRQRHSRRQGNRTQQRRTLGPQRRYYGGARRLQKAEALPRPWRGVAPADTVLPEK